MALELLGTYSKLAVSGTVILAGELDVDAVAGFNIPKGGPFDYFGIMTYPGNPTGDFTNFSYNGTTCSQVSTDNWDCGPNLNFQWTPRLGSLDLTITRAPEPGTIAILATGLLGLMGVGRRQTRAVA